MASLYLQRSAVFYCTRFVVLWRVQTSFSSKFRFHCGRKWQRFTPTALQISKEKLLMIIKRKQPTSLQLVEHQAGSRRKPFHCRGGLADLLLPPWSSGVVQHDSDCSFNQPSFSQRCPASISSFSFFVVSRYLCVFTSNGLFLVYVINLILKIKSEYELFYIAAWIRQVDVISISQRKDAQKREYGKWRIIYAIQLFTKFNQAAHHCFSCLCDKNWFFFSWIWAAKVTSGEWLIIVLVILCGSSSFTLFTFFLSLSLELLGVRWIASSSVLHSSHICFDSSDVVGALVLAPGTLFSYRTEHYQESTLET